MIIEYIKELNKIYLYGNLNSELINVTRTEKINNVLIYSGTPKKEIKIKTEEKIKFEEILISGGIKCKHGVDFKFKKIGKIMREGWEELLDCWVCHSKEKNVILETKLTPKNGQILISDFYFQILKESVPKCCNQKNIFYFNEVSTLLKNDLIIFTYLNSFFEMKNIFLIKIENVSYEIKYFYETLICKNEEIVENTSLNNSIEGCLVKKIGFKKTERIVKKNEHFNEFYKKKIYEFLIKRLIDVEIDGYRIGFLTYDE